MTALNEQQIKNMEAKGFNRWTKGDYDRMYFNIEDTDALDIEKYNTGNISYVELNGEEIAHSEAYRILSVKAYVDVATGKLVVYGSYEEEREIVMDEMEKAMSATENDEDEQEDNENEEKTYIVTDGDKAEYNGEGHEFTFESTPDDIDTAYEALAENLRLNDNDEDSQDNVDFQNAKDDSVEVLLEDMKRMGFIDSWEAEA